MDELIRKYFEEELTPDERLDVLKKVRKEKAFKEEFIHVKNMQALLQIAPQTKDAENGKNGFAAFLALNRRKKVRKIVIKTISYAAAIAVLIAGSWYANKPSASFVASSEKQNKLYVPAGQRACLTLTDGTEVWLNAGSTLTYPAEFNDEERLVSLDGEAYFHVSPNKKKPFIVSVKSVHVKALGTEFNIYGYAGTDYTCVSLLSGSVQVYHPGYKTGKNIVLKPYEQAYINDKEMNIQAFRDSADFSWKNGIYNFKNEKFESIIRKLEHYYSVSIIVKDPSILDFKYTGKFRQLDGVDEILRIIQKIKSFNTEKDMEKNIIYIY